MGLLHIYCGDGKGKTTAALGLAVRMAGAGKRVHIIQLMKGSATSELSVLRSVSGITLTRCDRDYGFASRMTESDKAEITACHTCLLTEGFELARSGKVDLLILDEFNSAYKYGFMDRASAEEFLLGELPCETVLTGRNPDAKFVEKADYVSEIQCVKHPYQKGVKARKGIEF